MHHRPAATRVWVISDLHLGGEAPFMMSKPQRLAGFIRHLAAMPAREDERIELVIAGDFVDFLAVPPLASFTASAREARDKLHCTMTGEPFGVVFDALGRFVHAGHKLTVLIGNHDVELALPPVQDALMEHLGATPHELHFVADGRAYRIGGALIEHGNRYDGANVNDWTGIRAMASAFSRHEDAPDPVEVSAGSRLVEKVVNPVKKNYPFIDLIKPEGELVALLLVAFEPGLLMHVDKLARLLHVRRKAGENARGVQPGRTTHVAARPMDTRDAELEAAFGSVYTTVRAGSETAGMGDLASVAWAGRAGNLASLLRDDEPIPGKRLEQIRVAMRKLLTGDRSLEDDGPTEQYGAAARRILESSHGSVEVVVMGHTHLARHIGPREKATYINTGTWADVIDATAVELDDDEKLIPWLKDLLADRRPDRRSTYAVLHIDRGGAVTRATLEREPA